MHTLNMHTNAFDMLCAVEVSAWIKWEPVRKIKYSFSGIPS
jgi:hypothetical protein